jgi:hypothetical protein
MFGWKVAVQAFTSEIQQENHVCIAGTAFELLGLPERTSELAF